MPTVRFNAEIETFLTPLQMDMAKVVTSCLGGEIIETGKLGLSYDAAIVGVAILLDKMINARNLQSDLERYEAMR